MQPSLERLLSYAGSYDLLPVYKKIDLGDLTSVEVLRRLRRHSRRLFLLEHADRNAEGISVPDRYSYIGSAPSMEIYSQGNTLTVVSGEGTAVRRNEDPRAYLRELIRKNRAVHLPELPPFSGGFAGYFSYEYISLTEPVCRFASANSEGYRDFDLMLFDRLYVIDRGKNCLYMICHIPGDHIEENYGRAEEILETMEAAVRDDQPCGERESPLRLLEDFKPIYPKEEYIRKVERARAFIQKGEVAQIVLTNGQRARASGELIGVYERIRENDPTRYMCYFSTGDVQAAAASPEPIAKLTGGRVMTERLAGSYARGATPEEDDRLAWELRHDAKAIDEHNMLVDDSRNEFGYISKLGTVRTSGYLNIVRCAKVMHMGTTITGELKDDKGALDVIDAITPSGAVSGAPKIRSCEVINEIEGERRGLYGSSVGYIGLDGDADFFVFIHAAFLKDGILTVRAGGGIVIDSIPEEEYNECQFKAEAMLNTLRAAAGENGGTA